MDTQPGVRFQLLGPVQVRWNGQHLNIGGAKPRAVLAALLYRANKILTTDELMTLVWGHHAEVARDSLYHCVRRIKAALAPLAEHVGLEGRRPGYLLKVAEPVVDWHRFGALVTDAMAAQHDGDPDRARLLYGHALGLWHGEPLADVGDALAEFRRAMTSQRLDATEKLAQLELQYGDPSQVVYYLDELSAQHPEREGAAALLVRALHTLGRRDEAIHVFQRSQAYAHSRGLDPIGVLEQAYQLVLHDAPPAASQRALRAGLPRLERTFVDRTTELGDISNVLSGPRTNGMTSDEPVVCAIYGMAGTGKSQLALRAAHALADHFPDGLLYIDLLGQRLESQPLEPSEALGRLLQTLGVPVERLPHELDQRAMVYRSALADTKRLIILDNATTSSQIYPLLPAEPECRVIITSRKRLTEIDDAHEIRLDVLDSVSASELFAAAAGLPTGGLDQAVSRIVAGCGFLPLAIRILAARYRDHSWSNLLELESALADEHERLQLLDDGERSITAAFTVSYRSLPDDQRRLFRLLGLIPGPESLVDTYDAAALAEVSQPTAQHLLAQLSGNGLLTQPAPRYYAFHDLLRTYARQRAQEWSETDQRNALARLFGHYCHVASLAMDLYAPYESHRRPPRPPPILPTSQLTNREQAQKWLDDHQLVLVSAAKHSAMNGPPSAATHLTQTLFRYLDTQVHGADILDLYSVVLHAARQTADREAEAHLLNDLAGVQSRYGRSEQAVEHLQHALRIDRELGSRFGEARTLGNLASAHGRLDNYEKAIAHHRQSVQLYVELGDQVSKTRGITNLSVIYAKLERYDEAIDLLLPLLTEEFDDKAGRGSALAILGNAYQELGRYNDALPYHNQALALLRDVGDRFEEAETLNDLGRTLRGLRRYDEARANHSDALMLARQTYNRMEQARAHDGLARINHALGFLHQAAGHWIQALTIFTELKSKEADEIRAQLVRMGVSKEDVPKHEPPGY